MNPHHPRLRSASSAFTLVEMLVSIAVLGIMMLGVVQIMNSAMNAASYGGKNLDADTQARLVLDRIAYDLSKIVKRTDVDYYFEKNPYSNPQTTDLSGIPPGSSDSNDQMVFFSESGGYFPTSVATTQEGSVSLVGYRINSKTAELERLSKGLTWNGSGSSTGSVVFLPQTIANTWQNPEVEGNDPAVASDPNYQVIGDQVFRLEFCYLVENTASKASSAGAAQTSTMLSYDPYYNVSNSTQSDPSVNNLNDVVAIVVAIAVLDNKSRTILGTSAVTDIQNAAAKLDDFTTADTGGTNTPLSLWKSRLANEFKNNPTLPLGLPPSAAAHVRFYQRFCYINHVE
jgi:prepilin-type N-terminal cleavage/methylation domain-containing protein